MNSMDAAFYDYFEERPLAPDLDVVAVTFRQFVPPASIFEAGGGAELPDTPSA